ncbi:hypothetical protein H7U19_07425 [Hyunsoonleella sp. SJ7]|uniref:Uncharacterized protein n=1 Tax=Hyunsoonleella aquatilis TaxID=2762758 RepID=A0A923KKV4_9FLAO|nr:hypothetical protein [Hyunsoonleella aquatilis]MBC3758228.1 hypothetical protein [Hyunsoonleella aquatilis]
MFFGCHETKKTEAIENIPQLATVKKKFVDFPILDSLKLGINFNKTGDYAVLKTNILSKRAGFRELYIEAPDKAIDSASNFLYNELLNNLVPHWYGTGWDFNGHTNTPNEGHIACGYFVSTTLKHLGFNLNRYKMAQQAGLIEALVLQAKNELKQFSNVTFNDLKRKLNMIYDDGIYFVGLDNHVGYILIKDHELYFLHSSYYDDKVIIELAETSPCFISKYYVFAEITTNKDLMRKWILNERLIIPSS